MSEAEVRERRLFVFNKLKKGYKPKEIIEEVIDKYGLTENYANKFVYNCNKEFNESLKDISDNAANFFIFFMLHNSSLQRIICIIISALGQITSTLSYYLYISKPQYTILA